MPKLRNLKAHFTNKIHSEICSETETHWLPESAYYEIFPKVSKSIEINFLTVFLKYPKQISHVKNKTPCALCEVNRTKFKT